MYFSNSKIDGDQQPLPFLSDRRSGSREGGEPQFLFVRLLVLGYLGFQVSSVNVMVERMLMVLVGIMVSQPMLLFVGGDAGAGERFVEPKLLEWLRSGVAPWRDSGDRLLLECGELDCCVFVEDGGGSGRLKGGVALALDPVLKKLWRAPPADVLYRARSSLTRLVAIAAC
jgi:hypothetical protein